MGEEATIAAPTEEASPQQRRPLREAVLALADDTEGANRLAGAGPYYRPVPLGYVDVLAAILDTARY